MSERTNKAASPKDADSNIHFGLATVPFGPHARSEEKGWHYPGGGFTQDPNVASAWACNLNNQLSQKGGQQ